MPEAALNRPRRDQTYAVKKYQFPMRMTAQQIPRMYPSLEQAFTEHDYIYVSRYGQDHPELRGCALLMLGNRIGGERVLDRHNIHTPRSCLYRAFAAWQHDNTGEAKRWIAEARAIGSTDVRLDRLAALIERLSFRIVFHCDFHSDSIKNAYRDLPGIEMMITQHAHEPGPFTLSPGQNLNSVIPPGPIDLVLLDDFKLLPIGIGHLGAPVAVAAHDPEAYYEYIDHIMPEIDLVVIGATSEAMELGRNHATNADVYFYALHMNLPEAYNLKKSFADTDRRTCDLLHTGLVGQDIYRYKKQEILSLAFLPDQYRVKINEIYYPHDQLWEEMHRARFSIIASRTCNYLSTRAIESVVCGTFHLLDEESGIPYLFSEYFHCFPVYRRGNCLADVERHLANYDVLLEKFQPQLPQFSSEFENSLPADNKARIMRFLRHLLFMTHVEDGEQRWIARKNQPLTRRMVYANELHHIVAPYAHIPSRFADQTSPSDGLRHALAIRSKLILLGKTDREANEALRDAVIDGLKKQPDSLALHYTLGVCQLALDMPDEAEKHFIEITSGRSRLVPYDPPPAEFYRPDSMFWINDAHIRMRCPGEMEPLVPAEDVWKSFAWVNRAGIILRKALAHMYAGRQLEAGIGYRQAADFAKQSLDLFMYNENVHKIYLRAAFGLASAGDEEWGDIFLQCFEAACHNDRITLHDFAAPAFHVLMTRGDVSGAIKILEDLKKYLHRVRLMPERYVLYNEFLPLMLRYGIPHTKLSH